MTENDLEYTAEIRFIGRRDGKKVIKLDTGLYVEGSRIIEAAKTYEKETDKHIPRASWHDGKWILEGTYIKEVTVK